MAIYSFSAKTTIATAANACLEVLTSSTNRITILEIQINQSTTTISNIGLGFPAAIGVGAAGTVVGQAEDPGDTASKTNVAFSTYATSRPTAPTNFLRTCDITGTIGCELTWTFVNGLMVPTSNSIVLWNISAISAMYVTVIWDE